MSSIVVLRHNNNYTFQQVTGTYQRRILLSKLLIFRSTIIKYNFYITYEVYKQLFV